MTSRAQAALPTGQRTSLETALDRLIARLDMPDDGLEYATRGAAIILSGRSPDGTTPYPIARFRYAANTWHLDWRRASERWSELDRSSDARALVRLPWGMFWG